MREIVVFAGAGFTAPYGSPVMRDFLHECSRLRWISEDDYELIVRIQMAARSANAFLESSPTNIEDMLTHALMSERLGLNPAGPSLALELRKIVHKIYSHGGGSHYPQSLPGEFKRFFGIDLEDDHRRMSFITTNYDLVLESAYSHLGIPNSLPFEHVEAEGQLSFPVGSLYQGEEVRVFKLHGSVNWYQHPENPDNVLVEKRVADIPGRKGQVRPFACFDDYLPGEPLIVPPSFSKPSLHPKMEAMWAASAERLREATYLIFVGYSFPPSDSEMRHFLACSLAQNNNLRKILVVDLHANEIVRRLKSPDSGFGTHFIDLLEAREGDWFGRDGLKLELWKEV